MAEKTKSTVRQVATAVQDVVATVVTAAKEHVVQPVESALGITADATKDVDQKAGAEAVVAAPVKKKSAATRMMTKSIAIKQSSKAKGKSRRVTDAAKPSQKPAGGSSSRARRRGASKGR